MKKFAYLCIALILTSNNVFATAQYSIFEKMQGQCENYATPMQTEFTIWQNNAIKLMASDSKENPPTLLIDTKAAIQLQPQTQVDFLAPPQKSFIKIEQGFAGIVTLKVDQDGLYKISAGKRVWFDLVDANTQAIVQTHTFEMQTHCKKIFKVVTFDLKANTDYILQISSSKNPRIYFLLTKHS